MVDTTTLLTYLETLLTPTQFADYAPNGLQVQGKPIIKKLVTGVTASALLLEAAIDAGADAILVHHGYFWKGTDPCIIGMHQQRLKTLLTQDINLLAYHLPLDAHPLYGNNAQLAQKLDITVTGRFPAPTAMADFAFQGKLEKPLSPHQFACLLTERLNRQPLYIPGRSKEINTIGWCTGAGQDLIEFAAQSGLDAYLTGEVSERTVHIAREMGIHFFAAGHHATERYGVAALGEHLAEHFGVSHQFIDVGNPV